MAKITIEPSPGEVILDGGRSALTKALAALSPVSGSTAVDGKVDALDELEDVLVDDYQRHMARTERQIRALIR